ncbi:MAG: DNA mismatch repair endonuclease MutL [Acholeplasmatales bacterium]|nr:DNA mismatch repair endonuclease MutL [Acholeplasmatales bacterium]
MGNIIKMSPKLASLIQAGEVVERPASVVKELVENAIDAKATNIVISLTNGGLEEIVVTDDGVGMDKDDVLMSFVPHATSKIKNEYDLNRILTLGFRGEAIASIATVSKMTITSSTDGLSGYFATFKSGIKEESGVCNHNKGTTVSVSNLFYNTPARLKYMKSGKKELASIMFLIDRIAMSSKDKRFQVYSDGRLIFQTSGKNKAKDLIFDLYGMDAAKNVLETEYTLDGYKCHLVLVKPQVYRSTKLEITLILNGRYVKNYNITEAIIKGFQTYLPIGKHPIVIAYFDVDPQLVDVNVHPNKIEVKIANEEEICNTITGKIDNILKESNHIPTREINNNISYKKQNIFNFNDEDEEDEIPLIRSNYNNEIKKEEIITPTYNNPILEEKIILKEESKENIYQAKENSKKIPDFEYVGSIFGTYLIFQNKEGMYLMDQHAAAERVNYEKFYEILGNSNQPKTDMLVPLVISFTKMEALYVEENMSAFNNIGFELEAIGELDYRITSIPLWAKIDNLEEIIYDILSNMIQSRKVDVIYFRDHIAKQIACKASIKANHTISLTEVNALVENLKKCKNPYTCPHGRPTIIRFSLKELEEMFERIQK